MAAENAEIEPGDTVAVWGCGPVAQMAIQSCWMLGAGRVIAIDRVPERLEMAGTHGRAETINFDKEDVYERLNAMTDGRGPDRCVDAVGCEAHGTGGVDAVLDNVKATVKLATDRAHVIRQAIFCCRKGGTVSVPGVYVGLIDKMPFGAVVNKGLTIKSGQTHVQRYGKSLLEKIEMAKSIRHSLLLTAFPLRKRQLLTRPSVTRRMGALKSCSTHKSTEGNCLVLSRFRIKRDELLTPAVRVYRRGRTVVEQQVLNVNNILRTSPAPTLSLCLQTARWRIIPAS
jgi:hypothetical protein